MEKFSVIFVDSNTGQIMCDDVVAKDGMHAFAVATADRTPSDEDGPGPYEFVVAIKGIHKEGESLTFPGSAMVDMETVLEQPDVFGKA